MDFLKDPEFWVAFAFVALVAMVAKPVWKLITKALDDKIVEIQSRIEEAERLRTDAQDMLAQAKRKLAEAGKEAESIVAEARTEAERLRRRLAQDAEDSLKRREKMAMDRIAQAEADATAEIRGLTADVALEAARSILSQEVQGARGDQLVDKAISEVGDKLH